MKKGWQIKKLGDLCKIELGKTPARANKAFWDEKRETGNVWLSIADLLSVNNNIVVDSKEYLSDKGAAISKTVRKGTLLVSFKLTLGRLAFAGRDLFTNEAIAALTIFNERELSKEFLFYFLHFFDWRRAAENDVKLKGMTLNKTKLKEMGVPLPPFTEQMRIVKVLDEVFEKITKAKENAEKNLQNAWGLFESYLQRIFANPGDGWEEKKLGDVCGFVRGPFGGSLKKSCFKPSGIAVYEQQHAIYDQFEEIRYFIDEKKFNEMQRFEVKPRDLIMSCSGTMGKVAIVPENVRKGIINQALLKLSPNKNLLVRFLKAWMGSLSFQDQLAKYSLGAAIKNVASVKTLKEINIPLPPTSEQRNIIAKLNVFAAETKKLETIYQQKLSDFEELKKSVLHKAFNGGLAERTREPN